MNLPIATFVAVSLAVLCGCGDVQGTGSFCVKVEKSGAKHLLTNLNAIVVDGTACSEATKTNCTECYTKKGTGTYIEYFAACGEISALGLSEDENKKWQCEQATACTAADGTTCHPILTSLSQTSGTKPSGTRHCPFAVIASASSTIPAVPEKDTPKVVCHDECAYGVGFDGANTFGYMGCNSGCTTAIAGKKTESNGKTAATCKVCTDCTKLAEKVASIKKTDPAGGGGAGGNAAGPTTTPRTDGSNIRASFMAVSAAASAAVLAIMYAAGAK